MKKIDEYITTIKNILHLDAKAVDDKVIFKKSIPFAIKSNYQINSIQIEHKNFILLLVKNDIKSIKKHLLFFQEALDVPIIFALESINTTTKKYLIENGISFITQDTIYLPQLLVYLDTILDKRKFNKTKKLSKLAQMTLIYVVLEKNRCDAIDINTITNLWDVSTMSASRTMSELVEHEYFHLETQGRKKYFIFNQNINLDKLLETMKTPIADTVYIKTNDLKYINQKAISSYTALSNYTNITSHKTIYAIEKEYFNKIVKIDHNITLYDKDFDDSIVQVELWRYPPIPINNDSDIVDIISLYLSLKDTIDTEDTRATDALNELEIQIQKALK